jgi:outer membrane receptor protein involved in Fe transport
MYIENGPMISVASVPGDDKFRSAMTGSLAFVVVQFLVSPGPPAFDQPAAQARVANVAPVAGVVRDMAGGLIPGALVIVRVASGAERQTVTDPAGRFTVTPPVAGEVTVFVRVGGFAEWRRTLPASAGREALDIVLETAGISEHVTVTPTRNEQRLGDVPASVRVLGRDEIRQSPAVVADDLLRQLPTFSLFRRASSVSAHPTTQGVSLRGIGPSGVSRTLVLLDGVPFNDSFGGWVYWTAVPLESAERIEVVDSASSSLYGTYALGGVINIMTSPPARRTLEAKAQYGNRRSPKLDFRGSDVWGKVGVALDASLFDTDGYPNVVAVNPAGVPERGPIDNNVSVNFRNFGLKLEYNPTDRVQAFLRTGYFREKRDNGKISTFDPRTEEANDTTSKSASGGVRMRMGGSSDLQATVFTDFKTFRSNFLAVPVTNPPRSIGRMTLNQRVPTRAVGGMVQWSRAFNRMHHVTAGTDLRWVDGDSEEDGLDAVTGTQVTLRRISGGTQRNVGAFVQDLITPAPKLTVTLSARVDRWRNYDPHNIETSLLTGVTTDPPLASRQDTVASPRVGALYRFTDRVKIWGDLGTGFRAPTLNELYRQFRVGTVLTLANPQLGPERLVGGEAGVSLMPARNLTWRTTWFDNRVKDPVSNVTQTVVGPNVTQQRQNLGRTRIWGVQTDVEYRLGPFWRLSGGYLYDQARVKENPANPTLEDKFLAQVPKHRGSVQVRYVDPRVAIISLDVQAIGAQFDDDQNTRAVPGYDSPGLPKYALLSLSASRAVGRNVEVFVAAQNLLDQQYFVGTLPTLVGPPRLVSGGIRVRLQGR